MSQNFSTYAVGQMPKIASPNLLDMKVVGKLTADRLNQTANLFAFSQLLRFKWRGLTIFGWHRKLKSLSLKKLFTKWLGQISCVGQQHTSVTFGQLRQHTNIMHVRSGQSKCLDHANRIYLNMQAETVKSLPAKFLAICRDALKELAKSGSGEPTNRNRKAVEYGNNIVEVLADVFK